MIRCNLVFYFRLPAELFLQQIEHNFLPYHEPKPWQVSVSADTTLACVLSPDFLLACCQDQQLKLFLTWWLLCPPLSASLKPGPLLWAQNFWGYRWCTSSEHCCGGSYIPLELFQILWSPIAQNSHPKQIRGPIRNHYLRSTYYQKALLINL